MSLGLILAGFLLTIYSTLGGLYAMLTDLPFEQPYTTRICIPGVVGVLLMVAGLVLD